MTPTDFTLEFYRKCLSQAKWNSNEERDIESVSLLIKVANERGGEFLDAYAQATHFPVASQEATETQNTKPNTQTNTLMNTLLNDIYNILIKPIVDAIDRNTAAHTGGQIVTPAATVTPCEAPPKEDEDKPAEPKKRGPKAKAEAAPAPEPEPEPVKETPVVKEEPYMSGADLAELMKPLKDTAFSKQLVEFRNNEVGFNKPTREMTDPAMLRQMEAKIREFLAENEAASEEV